MLSACNHGKRKSSEFDKKIVKSHQVNLFLAGFSNLKPLCKATKVPTNLSRHHASRHDGSSNDERQQQKNPNVYHDYFTLFSYYSLHFDGIFFRELGISNSQLEGCRSFALTARAVSIHDCAGTPEDTAVFKHWAAAN